MALFTKINKTTINSILLEIKIMENSFNLLVKVVKKL
ncbi:Uncharacterised protein [Chryseobacterium carnipullorum]|uniref:Uncharacterized protein n=1 Tax=Chryseobacterium carnipullorum TaxID=1124835 RepID=A0A376DUR1_CHRCU|nr:Uncharacterised protein [Chryseobacterium carnipullorum]